MKRLNVARTKAKVDRLYEEAGDLALQLVEQMARDILRKHPNLDSFVMAMGCASFSVKGEVESLGTEDRAYMRTLHAFIEEWDRCLHLTGVPMMFTADGPKVTQW